MDYISARNSVINVQFATVQRSYEILNHHRSS